MALAHFQRTFTDASGNVKPGLSVTVRRESDNGLAALFADAGSVTPKSNPFNTDANGYGSFYVVDGRYRIQATDIDWRNEDLIGQSVSNHVALPDPHSQYTTAAEVNAEFNQFGVGADGRELANADNAVLGSNNATRFDDNAAAVSGNYPDVGIDSDPVWWNLVTYGEGGRTTQVATEVYGLGGRPKGETFTRIKHDTWQPWVQNIFASDANFTAMPQVGGDPIVESGSNADGEWTRWSDGTQIVSVRGVTLTYALQYTLSYSWSFPVSFSVTPEFITWSGSLGGALGFTDSARGKGVVICSASSLSSTTLEYAGPASSFTTSDIAQATANAVGRWK